MKRLRRIGAAVLLIAVPVGLAGCASGDSEAADTAEAIARGIADDMAPPVIRDVTAEYLVSETVHGPGVTALAWSGRTGDEQGDGARVTVRVRVHQDEEYGGFVVTQEEGDAIRCFELAIRTWRYYDTEQVRGVDCPDRPAPPQPSGVRPEDLPDDVDARLTRALRASATAEAATAALRAALPRYATVDVTAWNGGLVAAVGAPAVQDCAVAVRRSTGDVEIEPVDQTQVQPGELGCSTQLVTNPPL